MTEPIFIQEALGDRFPNHVELRKWVREQYEKAQARGCTHLRVSNDIAGIGHTLVEGWVTKPEDEGAPRWGESR